MFRLKELGRVEVNGRDARQLLEYLKDNAHEESLPGVDGEEVRCVIHRSMH